MHIRTALAIFATIFVTCTCAAERTDKRLRPERPDASRRAVAELPRPDLADRQKKPGRPEVSYTTSREIDADRLVARRSTTEWALMQQLDALLEQPETIQLAESELWERRDPCHFLASADRTDSTFWARETRPVFDFSGQLWLPTFEQSFSGGFFVGGLPYLTSIDAPDDDPFLNCKGPFQEAGLWSFISISDLVVGPEGDVYVAGPAFFGATNQAGVSIARLRPDGLARWVAPITLLQGTLQNTAQLVFAPTGELYAATTAEASTEPLNAGIYEIDPESGALVRELELPGFKTGAVAFDQQGSGYALQIREFDWAVTRFDVRTGALLSTFESPTTNSSRPVYRRSTLLSDRSGNVYACLGDVEMDPGQFSGQIFRFSSGEVTGPATLNPGIQPGPGQSADADRIARIKNPVFDEAGQSITFVVEEFADDGNTATEREAIVSLDSSLTTFRWGFVFGTLDHRLDLDVFGNVYVIGVLPGAQGNEASRLEKLNGVDGSLLDQVTLTPTSGTGYSAVEVVLDPGGNIFVVGEETIQTPADGGTAPTFKTIWTLRKYTQEFVAVPTTQRATGMLSYEDRSIWAPGVGRVETSTSLFRQTWSNIGFGFDEGFTIPFLGEFGGRFDANSSGDIQIGLKAEIDGGTTDVLLPVEVEYTIPNSETVFGGGEVRITAEGRIDPAARMTSNFTPTLNAGVTSEGFADANVGMALRAFSTNIVSLTLLDWLEVLPLGYIPGFNVLDLIALTTGVALDGEWNSVDLPPKGLFRADFRVPSLQARSNYDEATASFQTDARDRFFKFNMSVTEAALRAIGGTAQFEFQEPPPPRPGQDEEDDRDFYASGSVEAAQLGLRADLGARQRLRLDVVPQIRYEVYDEPNDPSPFTTSVLDLNGELVFTMPSDSTALIRPTLYTPNPVLANKTELEVFPGITWETLAFGFSASAFGFDLISIGQTCVLCFDWDLSEILDALGVPNPNAVNLMLTIFDRDWQTTFLERPLPAIRVTGNLNAPSLSALSRPIVPMLIYDQVSPTVNKFSRQTNGTTTLVLYGDNFSFSSRAFIEHHGRSEEIVFKDVLNLRTMRVQIPNRFRLLPGIAKIWVTTDNGESEALDLAIEYPRPRLDTVNPNLWAADPDLAVIPLAVIDAQLYDGSNTFLSRRDYYIKMRDDLWTLSTPGFDNYGVGAAEYFPAFDFNSLPGFPTVLWDTGSGKVPLARFVQPQDNGIYNVRLDEQDYDQPQIARVTLCNPGPGGGMSRTIELTIAAPVPVMTHAEPPAIPFEELEARAAAGEFIEIAIRGPEHVPTFPGYEEPKFGNFNAASYVELDLGVTSIPLATEFVSSSLLYAYIWPADVLSAAGPGDYSLTVVTPSNGTQYFEELRIDSDLDGTPDPIPAVQGLVDSGGSSAPILFPMRYSSPVIESVSPPVLPLRGAAFSGAQADAGIIYNLTVRGSGFRPNSRVIVGREFRNTLYVDSQTLRVQLLPNDVWLSGTREVRVLNGEPAPVVSVQFHIDVVDTSTN